MVRKHSYTPLPLDQMNDAQVLTRAASILRRHTPEGGHPRIESARLLLLAMAMKIRSEKRGATAKENADA